MHPRPRKLTSATSTMDGTARTFGYQYDVAGNRTRITHPDGIYFDATYDARDRHTETYQNGGGRIVVRQFNAKGELSYDGRVNVGSSYGYDPISRLQSLGENPAGYPVTWTLGYNPASQITTQTRDNDSYAYNGYATATSDYAVNGLNQYTTVAGATFGYDANGNLTSNGGTTYGYDVENRLISTSSGATLDYDPLGRLWRMTAAGAVTEFFYDGDQLVEERDGSGNLLRRYVHGIDEDTPYMWYEGAGLSDPRSLQTDHQGSIVSVANSAGTPIAINTYDEYGVPGAGNVGRFQYTGQTYLPELGLYYYKARMYSSRLGRFLQTDPVGYKDQNNLYAYVANDPVNHADPSGLYECNGSKTNCASVAANYARAENSLKSGSLSKSDRSKISLSLKALGAPGFKNGVTIGFDTKDNIAKETGGRPANGFTHPGKDGAVSITLRNDYYKLYEGLGGTIAGRDYSRTSARDERAGILVHEGIHVYQFRNGLTLQEYRRDPSAYENPAYEAGKLINKANGSVSVYDLP